MTTKSNKPSPEEIDQGVREVAMRHLPPTAARLEPDSALIAAGMTSVALLELLVALEDRFGVSLTTSTADLTEAGTLASLQELVKRKVGVSS